MSQRFPARQGAEPSEQRVADVAALADARRARRTRRCRVLDVLVERVVLAQALLQRHELRLRVALEGDEEQARVELAEPSSNPSVNE